jgi:type I restriction enzyme M protein
MQKMSLTWLSEQAKKHFKRKDKILGQFWTPQEVADFIVSFASKYIEDNKGWGCDPACGDGVFLRSLKKEGFKPFGVDIDPTIEKFLDNDLKQYVKIANGLKLEEENKFDIVVGNPPFSSKYGRITDSILKDFEFGKGRKSQAIEILFLEKFIKLCKPGGVIGIILPQGIFSGIKQKYVRDYVRKHLTIIAVFSLPRNIFRNGKTTSKTCILIGKKTKTTEKRKILFGFFKDLEEIRHQSPKKTLWSFADEFLYPEFYLDRNPVLNKLPKLKEFDVEIKQGRTKYGNERKFSEKGIPFISAKTVTPYGIDFSKDARFVQPGSSMDYKNAHVEIGDIVFVRVGVGCIGRAAVITSEEEKGIADDWIYILQVKDKRLTPYYLVFWLQTPTIQHEIKRLARGVGTITIPISLLKEIPILIPAKSEFTWYEEMYFKMINERQRGNIEKAFKIKEEVCIKLERELFSKNWTTR